MDRCLKYPSLPKAYCSHCQGFARSQRPTFSTNASVDRTYGPLIEVLKDGGPIHCYDSHFRFGPAKGAAMLACVEVLREFGWATDSERRLFEPRLVTNEFFALSANAYITMQPMFQWSSGITVHRPFLHIQIVGKSTHIGLGPLKCQAICAVREELLRWTLKYCPGASGSIRDRGAA